MANSYFRFKKFTVHQDKSAMKVTTDSCLFGAYVAARASGYHPARVLDIGAGTGLLSLMFAQKNPVSIIDAVEIDGEAAVQAAENAGNSPWHERIRVIRGDIRKQEQLAGYDLVLCNPPFYEQELKAMDPRKNLARHEGLSFDDLIGIIKDKLVADGLYFLLLPYKRRQEIEQLFGKRQLQVTRVTAIRQTPAHDFFRIIIEGCHRSTGKPDPDQSEITIADANGKYTDEFTGLLADYYLYL